MAGDWIKMSTDLRTHPKVVRIASALKADRLRVVGGLHAVWCLFDAHSADGSLDGYTNEALDDLIGWPGFSSALVSVDWLKETPQGLELPRFEEHNGQSAKRRAQETERKRMARAEADLSASNADEKRTREEKRREEKEKKTPAARVPGWVAPDWMPSTQWAAFVAMRKAKGKRAPFTDEARDGIVADLAKFRAAGHDVAEVLQTSVNNGWSGVFAPKAAPSKPKGELSELFARGAA